MISQAAPPTRAPTVPNSMPVVQVADASGPTSCQHLLGPGVGGEVEVVARAAHQRVAHRPADQVQLVPGRGERGPEFERRAGSAIRSAGEPLMECLRQGK